jgi:hypothetical protein
VHTALPHRLKRGYVWGIAAGTGSVVFGEWGIPGRVILRLLLSENISFVLKSRRDNI